MRPFLTFLSSREADRSGMPYTCLLRDDQVARRRTSQTVAAMSTTDSASSQPPSINWNDQNRLAGW